MMLRYGNSGDTISAMTKEVRTSKLTGTRFFFAILLGLFGGLFIWVATPYIDVIINSNNYAADLCDGYLSPGFMFVILFFVLVFNPLLCWINRRMSLNFRQMLVIVAIVLISSSLPGDGLLRRLPYHMAGTPQHANQNNRYSRVYRDYVRHETRLSQFARENFNIELPHAPDALFPDELGAGLPTPAGDYFIEELPPLDPKDPGGPKQPIPWKKWAVPTLTWSVLLVFSWMMMIALAQIVLPQWRKNERLSFPMLTLQQSLVAPPRPGKKFGPLFHNKIFWAAVIAVFILRCLDKWNHFSPGAVPAVPLSWDLGRFFTEIPYTYLPGYIKSSMLFFMVIGVAYFMPTRINFSIWFFVLSYGIYQMLAKAYWPPYHGGAIDNHRMGGMIGISLVILFLGRSHWKRVFGLIFRKAKTEEDVTYRKAALMFILGCVGIYAWLAWVGMTPGWALLYVGFAFMVSLVITRVIAESGVPFLRMPVLLGQLVWLFPPAAVTAHAIYYERIFNTIFASASIASPAALAAQGMAIDEESTPRHRWRLGWILLAVLFISLIVCGAVHVQGNYQHSVTMDGYQTPLNPYWFKDWNVSLGTIDNVIGKGQPQTAPYSRLGHLSFGVGLAVILQFLSLSFPVWPIHPIGMVCMHTWWIGRTWVCVFIGWALKKLVLRYGGSRLYRTFTPFCLGLIVGEASALVLWGLVPGMVRLMKEIL